jgi:hypothetical protein
VTITLAPRYLEQMIASYVFQHLTVVIHMYLVSRYIKTENCQITFLSELEITAQHVFYVLKFYLLHMLGIRTKNQFLKPPHFITGGLDLMTQELRRQTRYHRPRRQNAFCNIKFICMTDTYVHVWIQFVLK